jgi:hypothetical protein
VGTGGIMGNPKHKNYNAIKTLYDKIYNLDRQWEFKHPSTMKKLDLQAYMNVLLQAINEAIDTAKISRIKGHELKVREDKEDESNDI